MNREIITKQLTKEDHYKLKRLTTSNIAFEILKIFGKHIGRDNEITRGKLFKRIYAKTEEASLIDELRWDFIKRAMHLCRLRTKCFIGSRYYRGIWRYFVVDDMGDAEYYINNLKKSIKRMESMQSKCAESVRKGWSKVDWFADVKEKKSLGYTGKVMV